MRLRKKEHQSTLAPGAALQSLLSPFGTGIYASLDQRFRDAVFGRDMLEVADDLVLTHPGLVFDVITVLAALQGTTHNLITEEEPGRIHHEYRALFMGGHRITPESEAILRKLAKQWGGSEQAVLYYGSVDTTPLFIRLIGKYVKHHGNGILTAYVLNKDGNYKTVYQALQAAVEWLVKRLETSKNRLLEFKTTNPQGELVQAWKDSADYYRHADGTPVNFGRPVASIEVQGLAYDALLIAMRYFPEQKSRLERLAKRLQARVLETMWMPAEHYFALGLDYDNAARNRRIETITANPAALLDTAIFDSIPAKHRQVYIKGIVERIFSLEFLTDAGIRSRSLRHQFMLPYWDYHGCFTVWPKETYDIAKGLRRQGFARLADELENRLFNITTAAQGYPEFIYVDSDCRVLYGKPSKASKRVVKGTGQPEQLQAWTVSAMVAITSNSDKRLAIQTAKWQLDIEAAVLQRVAHMPRLQSQAQLDKYYPNHGFNFAVTRA